MCCVPDLDVDVRSIARMSCSSDAWGLARSAFSWLYTVCRCPRCIPTDNCVVRRRCVSSPLSAAVRVLMLNNRLAESPSFACDQFLSALCQRANSSPRFFAFCSLACSSDRSPCVSVSMLLFVGVIGLDTDIAQLRNGGDVLLCTSMLWLKAFFCFCVLGAVWRFLRCGVSNMC